DAAASPATGSAKRHAMEQSKLVDEALTLPERARKVAVSKTASKKAEAKKTSAKKASAKKAAAKKK
ncbi:MAG TPA: RNA polymerase sigma factor, partial [Rhodospirillaceae bacterium]|nr:RNA polymerase sigma factor [Rhodospirillaceae bacterium]